MNRTKIQLILDINLKQKFKNSIRDACGHTPQPGEMISIAMRYRNSTKIGICSEQSQLYKGSNTV